MDTVIAVHAASDLVTRVIYPDMPDDAGGAHRISPGRLVIFLLETPRRLRIFAFRTLPGSDGAGALVPAVRPGVDLLLSTRSRLAASRIMNMLLYFRRKGIDAESLSDEFWLNLGVLLNGRLRGSSFLPALLAHETLT